MSNNSQLYRAVILDHHKNPRNFGQVKDPDGSSQQDNPVCGDSIQITYRFGEGKKKIDEIKFSGTGCSLTRAGASMLTEIVRGKTVEEIARYRDADFLADIEVPVTPARKKCVLLALVTLRKALGIKAPDDK